MSIICRVQFTRYLVSSVVEYKNQEPDIVAILLTRLQTLLSFHHYLYEPIFVCEYECLVHVNV